MLELAIFLLDFIQESCGQRQFSLKRDRNARPRVWMLSRSVNMTHTSCWLWPSEFLALML